MVLSYVLGAAVMYFDLPSSDYLQKGFVGAEAWFERNRQRRGDPGGAPRFDLTRPTVTIDKPDRTFDGFTLCTTLQGSWALLLDMQGNVVHQWQLPFRQAWPKAPHVRNPIPEEQIHWFRCHLYPNGDLLAIYHAEGDTPYGYGLAKLDRNSKLLWVYSGNVHHDVDVDEDGKIYTLTHRVVSELPPGLESIRVPYLADYLVVLSPEGRELETIPILEAFRDSPYALTLSLIASPSSKGRVRQKELTSAWDKGDYLHANSVRVLSRSLAPKFPLFKAGQVLISLRSLDTIAVLDRSTRCVVWAARGLWRSQHAAEFLDNGHLLLFDNLGRHDGARVLEYDPRTQAIPWSYFNENSTAFVAAVRGMSQRLPNGNTLIVDPENGRLFEVSQAKELVWECSFPSYLVGQGQPIASPATITSARRYRTEDVIFLKGGPGARP
jgi:hypothetical protein